MTKKKQIKGRIQNNRCEGGGRKNPDSYNDVSTAATANDLGEMIGTGLCCCCWKRGGGCERTWTWHPRGRKGCVCAGRGGATQLGLAQSHLCLGLRMGSETNHKNLRVLYTGNRTLFKANFTVEYYFSSSFFFFSKHRKFFKGIWSSQNNSQTWSRIRIISSFVTSQYIYTWFTRNRKILSPSPTNYKKQTEERQLQRCKGQSHTSLEWLHFFNPLNWPTGPFLISFKSRANVKQMIPHYNWNGKNTPRKHISGTDL